MILDLMIIFVYVCVFFVYLIRETNLKAVIKYETFELNRLE